MSDEITPESAVKAYDDDDPSGLRCQVCGIDIADLYSGRGRKPLYCADHRGSRSASSGGKPASSGGRLTKDDRLRQELTTMMGTIGVALMFVEQYDGLVIVDRTPATIDALMAVAATNPQVRKVLEQMVTVSTWGQVSMALAGIAVPIAVHHRLLPLSPEVVESQFLSESTRAKISNLPSRRRERMRVVPEPDVNSDDDDTPRDAFGNPL